MNQTEQYMLKIFKVTLAVILFETLVILIFFNTPLRLIFGLLFGYIFSLIFFRLIYLNVSRAVDMSVSKAKRYMTLNYAARYIITGAVLVIAGLYSQLSLFTCFLGLLSVKLAIYLNNFVEMYQDKQKK